MNITPSLASGTLSNIALVIPKKNQGYQPNAINGKTPPALMFHIEGENQAELTSDITDHFVEDNTTIQDQVALKPEKIIVHGFIGELNNVAPEKYTAGISAAVRSPLIAAFSPALSVTAQRVYNDAYAAYQTVNSVTDSAVSAWGSITGGQGTNTIGSGGLGSSFNPTTGKVANNQTKQQVMFQQFYGYWRSRTLFTVQTPWALFQNMSIESMRAVQDENTRMMTDFILTFKMIRFAKVSTEEERTASGRTAQQSQGEKVQGTVNPKDSGEEVSSLPDRMVR